MIKIDIDMLARSLEYIRLVNTTDIDRIQWVKNGAVFPITIPSIWKHSGLRNIDAVQEFILSQDI